MKTYIIGMKRAALFLTIILFSVFVNARSVNLIVGSNYLIEDKNITLVKVYEEKALICVNGVKTIVNEDVIRKVNDVNINLIKVNVDIATFDFEYGCKGDCVCREDCNNIGCFKESSEEIIEDGKPSETIVESEKQLEVPLGKKETVKNEGIGIVSVIAAVLIIVVLFLGVIMLWRRL